VGTWGFETHNQTGTWQSTFAVEGGGAYRLETTVHDQGRFTGSPGRFEMISSTGTRSSGTYRSLSPTSLEVTSPVGTVTWQRRPGPPAATAAVPFAGVWDASFVLAGVTWHQTIDNAVDGTYMLTTETRDSGYITASAGHWHMTSRTGPETDGTYRLINAQTMSFTGPLGSSVWTRTAGVKRGRDE